MSPEACTGRTMATGVLTFCIRRTEETANRSTFNPSVLGSNPSAPPFTSGVIAPDITDSHDGEIFTNGLCVAKVTAKDSCVTVAAMRV